MRHVFNTVASLACCLATFAVTVTAHGQVDHDMALIGHDQRDPKPVDVPLLPLTAPSGGPVIVNLGPPPVVYSPSADFAREYKPRPGTIASAMWPRCQIRRARS